MTILYMIIILCIHIIVFLHIIYIYPIYNISYIYIPTYTYVYIYIYIYICTYMHIIYIYVLYIYILHDSTVKYSNYTCFSPQGSQHLPPRCVFFFRQASCVPVWGISWWQPLRPSAVTAFWYLGGETMRWKRYLYNTYMIISSMNISQYFTTDILVQYFQCTYT